MELKIYMFYWRTEDIRYKDGRPGHQVQKKKKKKSHSLLLWRAGVTPQEGHHLPDAQNFKN